MLIMPVGGQGTKFVTIPAGVSAGKVANMLAENGIIHSAFGFRLLTKISGKSDKLKPGAYELDPSMAPIAIINKIANGECSESWITFPEGFTVTQIAERIEEERIGKADEFFQNALYNGANFQTNFPHPGNSLEGYLFPDTYLAPSGSPSNKIIEDMLKCFERKVAVPMSEDIQKSGMTLHEAITLASLIEREARVPADRPLVSAVLHNRLKINMRLQCDATVLYALGQHKDRVLYSDLEVDSPYNTYKYPGLPPGPIANPGLASIKAALRPAQVDYLYYVARPDGSHIFSRTLAEHQQAIKIARKDSN